MLIKQYNFILDQPVSDESNYCLDKNSSISSTNSFMSTQTKQYSDLTPSSDLKRKLPYSKSHIDKFVVKTSVEDAKQLDKQIARFIYGTNSPFIAVQHPEFCKLINMLRPGYTPPTRQYIAGTLLNNVYNDLKIDLKNKLNGKIVCLALDGWSNVHHDSIVCVCVTDISDGIVHLVDTIDTQDNSHTWDYLLSLAISSIQYCKSLGCVVGSLVTDNAANMHKMRSSLAIHDDISLNNIITYGCSAHLLNLLAKDIEVKGVKSYIKKIIKYFKYSHFFNAKLKMAGGKKLVLPQDVRWNTMADSIESYLENWSSIHKICTDNRSAVNSDILILVEDIAMKNKSQEYLIKLKKIANALDRVQSDNCTISEATSVWLNLQKYFETEVLEEDILEKIAMRFELAITPYHLLGYILDPRFNGEHLNQEQLDEALNYANIYHPTVMPEIITYQAQGAPFSKCLFDKHIVSKVSPLIWWTSFEKKLTPDFFYLIKQIFTAVSSSAGIERLFSTFGLVHTKLRNRLGVEKASKLVSVFKSLNTIPKSISDVE